LPVTTGVGSGQHWEGAGHLEVAVGAKRHSSVKVPVSADCKAGALSACATGASSLS
jgi:hypothetical protein